MQNIKKPCREPYISRERDPQSGASGGRLVLGVLELLSTINIVELKKMASPSVPSVSRVETSSESSSDSTSTTTSTVSEHSKTSNIINRYSCSVERGLYWVPYAGIHLERAFASMPRRSVKRHIIFCHACPSPAFFSTICANRHSDINKKYRHQTEKTEDWQTCAPSVFCRICYGIQP